MIRNRFAFPSAATASVFLFVFGLANFAPAQNGMIPANLPVEQRQIVEQSVKFAKQYHEAARLKNKIAKQDALKEHDVQLKAWLDQTNKKSAKEGVKEWVGSATITTQNVTIENRIFLDASATGGSFTTVKVTFPVAGLAPQVREQVGKLKRNESVRIAFASDGNDPLVFSKASLTSINAQMKSGKSIASIAAAGN
ncbi:MAG: hypothetical protein K2X38_19125 [Gemmataceae bacterium]|nr:hypothetical protein [Gemmataceae bacterium]